MLGMRVDEEATTTGKGEMRFPGNELCLFSALGTDSQGTSNPRIHFYTSSIKHEGTNEALLAISTGGRGLRITAAQAEELRDYLDEWIKGRVS